MSKIERFKELVKDLDPIGFPYCDRDADRTINRIKKTSKARPVWYFGKITQYDRGNSRTSLMHCIVITDSGHAIDINQPEGMKVFKSASEYWKKSANRIEKYE